MSKGIISENFGAIVVGVWQSLVGILPTAERFLYQVHVAKCMARIHDLIQDVPMLSTGVPCTNEAREVANGGKFIARVAFASRLVVLSVPVLMARVGFAVILLVLLFPVLFPFRRGGGFHGG